MEVFLKRYRCEGWLHNIRYTTLSKGQKLQSKEGQQDSESGRWDGTAHLGIYGHFKQQRKLWDVDEIIICKSCSFFPWKAEGQLGMFPVFLTLGSRKDWRLMNWRREILDRLLNSSWLPNFCSVEEAVAILIKTSVFDDPSLLHEKVHKPTKNYWIQTSYCYARDFRLSSTTCTNQYFNRSLFDSKSDCAGLKKHLFSQTHHLHWRKTQKRQVRFLSNIGIWRFWYISSFIPTSIQFLRAKVRAMMPPLPPLHNHMYLTTFLPKGSKAAPL